MNYILKHMRILYLLIGILTIMSTFQSIRIIQLNNIEKQQAKLNQLQSNWDAEINKMLGTKP